MSQTALQQKMAALRLQKVMSELHTTAQDRGKPEDEGVAAAQELGRVTLAHFDLIIWALRVAGGARRP